MLQTSGGSRGGAGGDRAPPYFYTKMRPEGAKKNFETGPPTYLRLWMTGPPPYLKVWIRHCKHFQNRAPFSTKKLKKRVTRNVINMPVL